MLHDYFAWATTVSMARYPESADDVPDGLADPALVVGRASGRTVTIELREISPGPASADGFLDRPLPGGRFG